MLGHRIASDGTYEPVVLVPTVIGDHDERSRWEHNDSGTEERSARCCTRFEAHYHFSLLNVVFALLTFALLVVVTALKHWS